MFEVLAYVFLGATFSSFHIGNSLAVDGFGNQVGPSTDRTYGIEAIAASYGHVPGPGYTMGMHIDASQSLEEIWNEPEGDGIIDLMREPYGSYANALPNYEWSFVTLQPYPGANATLATDQQSITHFIDLTRQNPDNRDTVFYISQVWPRLSSGNYSASWLIPTPNDLATPMQPTRAYYEHLMDWAHETYAPQGIAVREIPTGEVWNRVNLAIQSGELTGVTLADFYRDDLHGSQGLGRYLASVTQYATLFQQDINDLLVPRDYFGNQYPQSLYDQLNSIIWDVVVGDSDTGLADFNNDGRLTSADVKIWSASYGLNSRGDTGGDGQTDGRDFLTLQRHLQSQLVAIFTVPEPTCWVLLGTILIVGILRPLK